MPIEGQIKELGLFELLQLISLAEKKGILTITTEETVKPYLLYFEKGNLVSIEISQRLKKEMIKRGFLNEEEVIKIEDEEFVKYLIEKEVLPLSTFRSIYIQAATDVLYSLFLLKNGHFVFEDVDFEIPEYLVLNMKIENIIMEAARRIDEISKMEEILPNTDIVLEVSMDLVEKKQVDLSPMDWKLLSLINGNLTISDLINKVGDKFAVMKSLYGMVMAGIITEKKIPINEMVKEIEPSKDKFLEKMNFIRRLWNKGEYDEGVKELINLKEIYPENPLISYNLGYFYLAKGNYKEAISEWNSFLVLSSEEKRKEEIRELLDLIEKINKNIINWEVLIE
ncbi:MAG: DUF4388 domain-containing protein [candidate division WOR-3 bacterium]